MPHTNTCLSHVQTSRTCKPLTHNTCTRHTHECLTHMHASHTCMPLTRECLTRTHASHTCMPQPLKRASCSVLQCVAVCCSVLQCVQCDAVCCSVLQCVAVCCSVCSVLQCVAECCRVLQSVAECCSVLQCVAARKSHTSTPHPVENASCSVLQCVAVRCSVLRVAYVAVCCSVLQCDAVAECCSEQITRIHASSYREGRGAKACRDSRFISPLTQFLKCQFCSRFAQQTSQHADFGEFLSGKVRCASTQCGEILKSLVATKCTVCNDCKSDF